VLQIKLGFPHLVEDSAGNGFIHCTDFHCIQQIIAHQSFAGEIKNTAF
jgi:hypothetical protein